MDWPRGIALGMEWLWSSLGLLCVLSSAWLAARPGTLAAAEAWLERLDRRPCWRWTPFALFGLGVPALFCLLQTARYFAFEMIDDSALSANAAWNLAHGYGPTSSILSGMSVFAIHFSLPMSLLSPLLLAWPHILALFYAQTVVVGSSALAVYLIGRRLCRSSLAGWLLGALVCAHPFFRLMMIGLLDDTPFAFPFFVWAVYFWESGRPKTALAFAILLMGVKEQAPLIALGFGLLLFLRARDVRGRAVAAAVAAGSVALWLAEMAVIHLARRGVPHPRDFWCLFGSLGGSVPALLQTLLREPWRFAVALVFPFSKLWTVSRTIFSFALLPLASGEMILPALTTWLPQQLSDPGPFQSLAGHYCAFVAGPLFWAAAHGFRRVWDASMKARPAVAAWVLFACGTSFFASANFVPTAESLILKPWRLAGPPALALVGPQARVWSDDLVATHLALRHFLLRLPWNEDAHFFENEPFTPDRVVMSDRWLALAEPRTRDGVLRFLSERHFRPIFRRGGLIVFAEPGAAAVETPAASRAPRVRAQSNRSP